MLTIAIIYLISGMVIGAIGITVVMSGLWAHMFVKLIEERQEFEELKKKTFAADREDPS